MKPIENMKILIERPSIFGFKIFTILDFILIIDVRCNPRSKYVKTNYQNRKNNLSGEIFCKHLCFSILFTGQPLKLS